MQFPLQINYSKDDKVLHFFASLISLSRREQQKESEKQKNK
jgi:hypothetical protein